MSLDELSKTRTAASAGWTLLGASDITAGGFPRTAAANGRIWGLGGNRDRTVISSSDGVTWQANNSLPYRAGYAACAHDDAIYISGGTETDDPSNDVLRSTDGVNWTRMQAQWPARYNHCMVSYQGNLVVFGGRGRDKPFEDMWTSRDGVNWVSVGACPPGVASAAAAVLDTRICVAGGPEGIVSWYDGREWKSDHPPWAGARFNPGIAVLGPRLYVLGGTAGPRPLQDLWSCGGPASWRPEAAPPVTLVTPGVAALDGSMVVFGGTTPTGTANRDIYGYTP